MISNDRLRELRKALHQFNMQTAKFGRCSDQGARVETRLLQACRNVVQEDDDQ